MRRSPLRNLGMCMRHPLPPLETLDTRWAWIAPWWPFRSSRSEAPLSALLKVSKNIPSRGEFTPVAESSAHALQSRILCNLQLWQNIL